MVRSGFPEDLDLQDPRDPPDRKATVEQTERLELQELAVDQGYKVPQAHLELQVHLEQLETLARLVLQVPKE